LADRELSQELLTLKEQLEQKKIAKAEAKGRLDELYRQLQVDFNCTSKEEAEEYEKELEEKVEELEAEIKKGIQEVRDKLGGINSLH